MKNKELALWLATWLKKNVNYTEKIEPEYLDDICVDGYVDFIRLADDLRVELNV